MFLRTSIFVLRKTEYTTFAGKLVLLCKTNCIYRSFSPQSVSLSKSGSKNPKNQTHSQKSSGSLGDNTPFAARVSKGRELNG